MPSKQGKHCKHDKHPSKPCKEYDFIIVGGGTSGCVLASRLSETEEFSVLLIERGDNLEDGLQYEHINPDVLNPDYFKFITDFQKSRVPHFRANNFEYQVARGLGGNTINDDQLYFRGPKQVWNSFESENCPITWNTMLPFFTKLENATAIQNFYPYDRGNDGPYKVIEAPKDTDLTNTLAELSTRLSLSILPDYNTADSLTGVSAVQLSATTLPQYNTIVGQRQTSYKAFILNTDAHKRDNLTIIHSTHVTKILYQNDKATGVEYCSAGKTVQVTAKNEVILVAGAVSNPRILKNSNINLSQIGKNLHNTIVLGVFTFNDKRTFSQIPSRVIAHVQTTGKTYPDVQYLFEPQLLTAPNAAGGNVTWKVQANIVNHDLRGEVVSPNDINTSFGVPSVINGLLLNITPTSPTLNPLLQPSAVTASRKLEGLLATGGNLVYVASTAELLLDSTKTDADIIARAGSTAVRRSTNTLTRQALTRSYGGTCQVGFDQLTSVVNRNSLLVHNFSNLRICDGSIFPAPFGQLQASTMAMAEKCAYDVKSAWINEFDFVVVGSGPGGIPVLSSLSECERTSVALVDIGQVHLLSKNPMIINDPITNLPVKSKSVGAGSSATDLNARELQSYSSINVYSKFINMNYDFLVNSARYRVKPLVGGGAGSLEARKQYTIGGFQTYEYWKNKLNLNGWGFNDVKNLFAPIQTAVTDKVSPTNPTQGIVVYNTNIGRGNNGPLIVSNYKLFRSNLIDILSPVIKDINNNPMTFVPDPNAVNNILEEYQGGIESSRNTSTHGFLYDEYINIWARKNLQIITGSKVSNVVIKNSLALGVKLCNGRIIKARKEVILAASTFGTAQIMLLSGIGRKEKLDNLGIKQLLDLPVGEYLYDHFDFLTHLLEVGLKIIESGYRLPLTAPAGVAGGNLETTYGVMKCGSLVDLQEFEFKLDRESPTSTNISLNKFTTRMRYGCNLLRHNIRGKLNLVSKDPNDVVQPDGMYEIFESHGKFKPYVENAFILWYRRHLDAFQQVNPYDPGGYPKIYGNLPQTQDEIASIEWVTDGPTGPIKPGTGVGAATDAEILAKIAKWAAIYNNKPFPEPHYAHYMSTCPMGDKNSNTAVIDENFKVYGMDNLRICDCSIIPVQENVEWTDRFGNKFRDTFNISPDGHPTAWLYMFGYKCAQVLKDKYKLC